MSALGTAAVLICALYLLPLGLARDSRTRLTTAARVAIPIALGLVPFAKYLLDRAKLRADQFHAAMDKLFDHNPDTRADAVRALEQMLRSNASQ
ncbi:hypothetical protein D7D52_10220 [Nocardia yunnanensis]|uniref:Uncharacterized protein n=1 Tax=Nocardia yunnanensis TaxID=2382165 RepID=A0A386ZAG9_9NOCA|nr:hypothetical protein D7D52_10220 [Nocardia yunnanensis]